MSKFSIKEHFKKRSLSWSQLSSFEYSKEQWYDTYILGNRQTSREMTFGSIIDKKFQDDPTFIPHILRGEYLQYKVNVLFNGIPLVGVPDILSIDKTKYLADIKTGKKKWDKKRADETGQLTFYLLLLFIALKVRPEDFECAIHWLPTKESKDFAIELIDPTKVVTIPTKRTMRDLLVFGNRIMKVIEEMEEYVNKLTPVDPPSA